MPKSRFTIIMIGLVIAVGAILCWAFSRRSRIDRAVDVFEPEEKSSVNITIDATQRYQTIEGMGTAMAYWVTSPYDEPGWTKMYYQDLGCSMLRVDLNINALRGPDDDLATPVTMVDDINANIKQFDFHNAIGKNIGTVVAASKTQALDGFKLIGSVWSPPNWMKGPEVNPTTGQPNGKLPHIGGPRKWDSLGGSLLDTPENLQQFGRYVAAYVKGFQEAYGVPFYAISIQNELAFSEQYNSCVYTPEIYVDALKAVASAFKEYGITTKIEGPEDVGVGSSSGPGILARQMSYINAVNADPVARAALDIYSIHGYANDGATPSRSPEMWDKYWSQIKNDGKESWMTETSGEPPTLKGALRLANNAMDALVQGNVNAWVYWLPGKQGSDGTDTLTNDTNASSLKYNAAKAFLRYIRPGAVRVSATPSNADGVYVGAFVHDANKTLTTVLINDSTTTQTVNLTAKGGSISSFNVAREMNDREVWADIGPINFSNGNATLTLPPSTIVTLQGTFNNER